MDEAISARAVRARLERGEGTAAAALDELTAAALGAPTRPARFDACQLLGDLAGRALGAEWETAERAAFALLEAARLADTAADRRGVIAAMGHGFRNLWLLPFVHRRLHDRDPTIAAAALHAAGGLGFPALEEAVAEFLSSPSPTLRLAAIAALGRMGATSAVDRLVPLIPGAAEEAAAALTALTEIRADAGRDAAQGVLDHELEPEVQLAAVRYLAELGAIEVLPTLRRLARHDSAECRLAASLASRALKAERSRDAGERFLIALSEPDRAVRAVLARRLRTLPVAIVLEQAELLLGDDAAGVIQLLGEVREPEVTRYLLAVAARPALPLTVRARAIGAIEADLPWERDELTHLAHRADVDDALRAAAVQAMGSFVTLDDLLVRVGALAGATAAALRGAFLWALQLAARPRVGDAGAPAERAERAEPPALAAAAAALAPLLDDPDPSVRRRAVYVAGNLGLASLAPALARACGAAEPADLRLAAYVALGELGLPGVVAALVPEIKREDDGRVLGAASNALVAARPAAAALAALAPRATALLSHQDPLHREAGAELAGLLGGAVPPTALAPLLLDPITAVRGAAVAALGRLGDPRSEAALLAAFRDVDPAIQERAAAGLLALATPATLTAVLSFVAGDGDPTARGELATALTLPPAHAEALAPVIDDVLARIEPDDPAFEPLLRLKLAAARPGARAPVAADVDAALLTAFPAFGQLTRLAGFDVLVRSLRTAESLFQATGLTSGAASGAAADADLSPPITLWMKALENFVHAWLAPRLTALQRDPATLFGYVDAVVGGAWPTYQRWLEPRWKDPLDVGAARVELPLRAIPNAVRELQEHRRKRLDSPLSVTEWARMIVLFGVEHPSGFKNLLRLGGKPEKTVTLAHRLHALAAVRNLVTHRASAGATTLTAFRKLYYAAFEDVVALA